MNENIYRASDMSLVTYLRLRGYEVQDVVLDEKTGSCYWMFNNSQSLAADVELYLGDGAVCNPRAFNREFALTRNELHATASDNG